MNRKRIKVFSWCLLSLASVAFTPRLLAGQAGATFRTEQARSVFRVTPYVQNPAANSMTLIWFSNTEEAGQVRIWRSDNGVDRDERHFASTPVLAAALRFHPAEATHASAATNMDIPYYHQLRIDGLEPGNSYRYEVTQNDHTAGGHFRTPASGDDAVRFVVYADSETEPESNGKHAAWPGIAQSDRGRLYPVDQTTGYAENLRAIAERHPDFIAIAGDLVQSGGEQRDWNEFWRHNADLASSIVILPALGNHDYFGGPGALGRYSTKDTERAVRKYQTYFDLPSNGSVVGEHDERYYELVYGPLSLIVLDTNTGLPHGSQRDTNWRLRGAGEGGVAPDWHAGSRQYRWLKNTLEKAQRSSRFTFVMFHNAPYSSGIHGVPPGEAAGRDILSGQPLQELTPLFMRYGVDAIFNGHDEMYEHSVVTGQEVLPDNGKRRHALHFFVIGIGGDGLRGPLETASNRYRVFLAHADATEVYDTDGRLLDGGKHYGHLEVNVEQNAQGRWQARIDAVYVFPLVGEHGKIEAFQRRLYDDSTILNAVPVSADP